MACRGIGKLAAKETEVGTKMGNARKHGNWRMVSYGGEHHLWYDFGPDPLIPADYTWKLMGHFYHEGLANRVWERIEKEGWKP